MRVRTRFCNGIALTLLVLSLHGGGRAQAQGQSRVHIHEAPEPEQITTTARTVGLSFQPSFSLLDGENQVLTAFEIENATITVEEQAYPATVQALETPWTIIVVVDASRTMGGFTASSAFKSAKTALERSIGGVPENTNLALVTFDEAVTTRVEFTTSKEAVTKAVGSISARSAGNSCLHNGVYEAVNILSGAPGRRAVIVFTASSDNCAERTAGDVVALARSNQVQIYPVGLRGYGVTQEDIEALANPTGGVAEFKEESTLSFGFSNVMAILNNQWTARATIYPSVGEHEAVLTVNLKDQASLTSSPMTFTSAQDYVPPTEIHLTGAVQSTAEGILFNLDLIQADKIRQLNVSIISKATGQAVLAQSLVSFANVNSLPAVALVPGQEYTLIVNAIDGQGQPLSEDSAEFRYEPPSAALVVSDVQNPTADSAYFNVTVTSQNLGNAVKYKAWLADGESRRKIEDTEVSVPLGEPILIPANDVASGQYVVVVQALDSGDTVLTESAPAQVVYRRPSVFERLRLWVSRSPLATAALTGLCCLTLLGLAGIGWWMFPKGRGVPDIDVDLVMPEKARPAAPPAARVPPAAAPKVEPRHTPPPQPPVRPAMPEPATEAKAEARQPASKSAIPAARFVLLFPKPPEFSIEIRRTPFTVGRSKDNEVALPLDNSTGVSGKHLTVFFKEGRYYARDDKSTFGTTINGEELNKGEPAALNDGDRIGLGPMVKLQFEIVPDN